jgi:4-amino-4-deoxy-L-arabinose transferase-like glycosyltransferase
VTQTDNPPTATGSLSLAARLGWIALILVTLYICYLHNLGALGLVGPDEPRYAWIARDMAETGDWVTPRLYGKPWFEKPVLYYWGAALCFKLFGVSEVTARLPSAISALLATLSLAWLAWRVYGAETARWLLLLLPTTVGMIGFSHAAATDMPFAGTLTIAMVFTANILGLTKNEHTPILPRTPWLALILFGFFLGLATLAKGPAALILSGGAVLLWAVLTKRWRDAFRCLHPVAIAAFCLTALPWYILCAQRNPDFFRVFIIEHNFKRYLTPEFQHIQPFWFYIPVLLVALFPWTFLLIPVVTQLIKQIRQRSDDSHLQLFLASLPAFTLLFFSISKSKLPGYILPALPPFVLLCSRWLSSAIEQNHPRLRWIIVMCGAGLFVVGLMFPSASEKLPWYSDIAPSPMAMQLGAMAIFAGLVALVLAAMRRYRVAVLAFICLLLLLIVNVDAYLQKMDYALTARGASGEAIKRWPGFSMGNAASWRLKRSLEYQLNFYNHSVLPEWQSNGPKPLLVFVDIQHEREVSNLGFACPYYLVLPAVIACRAANASQP